jgi:hypothetical protein
MAVMVQVVQEQVLLLHGEAVAAVVPVQQVLMWVVVEVHHQVQVLMAVTVQQIQ